MNSFAETLPKSALRSREGDYDMLATSIRTNSQRNRYFCGNHHTENKDQDDNISTSFGGRHRADETRSGSGDGRQENVVQNDR